MIIERSRMFSEEIGVSKIGMQFSDGWLNNFKKRHNFSHHVISGESLGVNKIVTDAAR